MYKNKKSLKFLTISIPLIGIILFVYKDIITELLFHLPKCLFYTTYHLYCPACGNTRSIYSLMNGDIASALRYNITPVVLLLLLLCGYIELAAFSFNKRILLLPRKSGFYLTMSIIMVFYLLLRNFIPYLTP